MVTVKLLKDIEAEGLFEGDVISVDSLSAAGMVKRGVAAEYTDADETAAEAGEPAEYAGRPAATIDDIHDPEAHHDRRVQTVVRVGGPDPGPPRKVNAAQAPGDIETDSADVQPDPATPPAEVAPTEHKSRKKAASGAQPDGGDAGGGDGS